VDAYPSHLLPATGGVDAALKRARINFFIDTWNTKANSFVYRIAAKDGEERDQLISEYVAVVKKEIEPLLEDAKPFFGGSEKLTLAEVSTDIAHAVKMVLTGNQAIVAPFLLRVYTMVKHDIIPKSLVEGFDALPDFSKWVDKVIKHDSVLEIFDEEAQVAAAKKKFAKK
jgi:glutathione S-transferase